MAQFRYIAKDKNTQTTVSGIIEAQFQDEAQNILHSKNFVIISLKQESAKSLAKRKITKRVAIDDLVIFSRQLATLIDSGINLVAALEILKDQVDNRKFAEIIYRIYLDIEAGKSFCDAVAQYPATFSDFYISMIKSGEASGMLNDVLERLALYLEKSAALQRKIKASLMYPAVIVSMAVIITIFLLVKVVPTFKGIFESLGGTLPLPTLILIGVSEFLRHYFLLFAGLIACAVIGARAYINTSKGRYNFDKLILRLPVFGILVLKVAVAKFAATFSTLVKSGVPVLNALQIVAATSGNKIIEEAIEKSRESVRQGEPIYKPLERSKVFPIMVVRMIHVGEQTGQMEKMLSKISDFYEDQVDNAVSSLTSLIEPLIIAFLGVVIGGIVIALFLPIFKITQLVAH